MKLPDKIAWGVVWFSLIGMAVCIVMQAYYLLQIHRILYG